jgi:YggT family protein
VSLLCFAGQTFLLILLGRIVLSWFYPFSEGSPLATVYSFVFAATEWLLGPIRRAVPYVRVGGMALDLSPIIVLLFLEIVYFRLVC